jgi:endonuclease/exonuclease/phosphatase family metal-dependent hydrolase
MKLATYNVANLFERARILDLPTWSEGRPVLEAYAKLQSLLAKDRYTATTRRQIQAHLATLGLARADTSRFACLRQNRGKLRARRGGKLEIVAEGCADWLGWVELRTAPVNTTAMRATARVLRAVDADVQAVVEADSRPALDRFYRRLVARPGVRYAPAMLIDGNDDRGIDVGLVVRRGYTITRMLSHVGDTDREGVIFSRDCAEYAVRTPGGAELVLLVNHFKSQGYGSQAESLARRRRQARRVAQLYRALVAEGHTHVAVVGDLNDHPRSPALATLLRRTDLRDVSTHPSFDDGGHPGTHGDCRAADKLDYLLLSPSLYARVTAGGYERRGMWGGKDGRRFERFPQIRRPAHAASDHAAVWATLDLH